MKRSSILVIIIISIFSLILFYKGSLIKDMGQAFKITEIILPEGFGVPLNTDDLNIEYSFSNSKSIEIIFNDEIKQDDYKLGFAQNENFRQIESKYNLEEYLFLEYKIDKNKIIINDVDNNMPMGVITILIPDNISSANNVSLEQDYLFLLSDNKLLDKYYTPIINTLCERDTKSIVQVKTKGDNKKISFINEDIKLYSNENLTEEILDLYRSESVIVKDTINGASLVELHFPLSYTNDMFENKVNLIKGERENILTGYVNSEDLIPIHEPLNKGNYYFVTLYDESESGKPSVMFTVVSELYDVQKIYIGPTVDEISEDDIHNLECGLPIWWAISLCGNNYNTSYGVPGIDGLISYYDVEAHYPEYYWTDEDYNLYCKFYDFYYYYLVDKINNYNFTEELSYYKNELINFIKNKSILDKIWVDWGYKSKVENNYFFNEILNRVEIEQKLKDDFTNIFSKDSEDLDIIYDRSYKNQKSSEDQQVFMYKLNYFMSNYLNILNVLYKNQSIVDGIFIKYNPNELGESVEINEARDNMNNKPNVTAEKSIRIVGEIIEIEENYEYIVVKGDDNITYKVFLTDKNEYGTSIKTGMTVKIGCILENEVYYSDGLSYMIIN